jgi:hypothetical protein
MSIYLVVRGIVRAIFWGSVVVGSCLLIDWFGREVILNLPW